MLKAMTRGTGRFPSPLAIRRPDGRRAILTEVLPALLLVVLAASAASDPGHLTVGDFDPLDVDTIPSGWGLHWAEASDVYSVTVESGNAYIHADQTDGRVMLGTKVDIDLAEYPVITWRWRVHELPVGAKEDEKDTCDSGAAMVIVFKRGMLQVVPKCIKYVWSSTLEPGTELTNPFSSKTKVRVQQSGMEEAGRWITERANVYEDYVRWFGKEPPQVDYVALMSDSDTTHSRSVADYDEIHAYPANELPDEVEEPSSDQPPSIEP